MKTLLASLLLLMTIAILCAPLCLVWAGIVMPLPAWAKVAAIAGGLILCWLVRPLSILAGRGPHDA